jgi:hypothetical protein
VRVSSKEKQAEYYSRLRIQRKHAIQTDTKREKKVIYSKFEARRGADSIIG